MKNNEFDNDYVPKYKDLVRADSIVSRLTDDLKKIVASEIAEIEAIHERLYDLNVEKDAAEQRVTDKLFTYLVENGVLARLVWDLDSRHPDLECRTGAYENVPEMKALCTVLGESYHREAKVCGLKVRFSDSEVSLRFQTLDELLAFCKAHKIRIGLKELNRTIKYNEDHAANHLDATRRAEAARAVVIASGLALEEPEEQDPTPKQV
jgi:hypothetical protein